MGNTDTRDLTKKKIQYWTEVRDKHKKKYEDLEARLKKAEEVGADKPKSKWHKEYKKVKAEWVKAGEVWVEADQHIQTLDKAK